MTLRSPELLALLLVVPGVVAVYAWRQRLRARRTAVLATQGMATAGGGRGWGWRRHLPFALFAAALVVLVVAMTRPMATIATPERQASVVLALDVSNSMEAADVKPSRLQAAKSVAEAFTRRQPSGVRIAVVAFGQNAAIVQPLTSDHAAVLRAIDRVTLGGGTSLADGVLTSLDALAGKTLTVNEKALNSDVDTVHIGYYGGSTIVVLSDGENTDQPAPQPMARLASVAGVRIDTIGLGTTAGTTVKVDGFSLATALDPATLQAMAKVTSGSYHQAGGAEGLAAISRTINLHFTIVHKHTEITALFAAGAAVLLVAAALLSILRSGRVM